jgi:hypothetical protein
MNGSWFPYGQQPTKFKRSWIKVYNKVKTVAGKDNVALLWAPNSGNGYPFKNGPYSRDVNSTDWDSALDTNGDGQYDERDDPYTPFYPGDEYVDWVGFSVKLFLTQIYHYGADWFVHDSWITNDVPARGKAENIIRGYPDPIMGSRPGFGSAFDFYKMFSEDRGKPFFITETGATVHLAISEGNGKFAKPNNTDAESRVRIKQGWWRQLLNTTFLQTHPKVKGISFFEFIKYEEESWRDFTTFGKGTELNSPLGNDGGALDGETLEAFRNDVIDQPIGKQIIWGKMVKKDQGSGKSGSLQNFVASSIVALLVIYNFINCF